MADDNPAIRLAGADGPAVATAREAAAAPAAAAAATTASRRPCSWSRAWQAGLLVLVLATLAAVFAEPVRDGDLWWQMAYGRQLLENRTLKPDHTVYSWTIAAGDRIYCAWIAQIFFFLAYCAGRLPALFLFRYLAISTLVGAVWLLARWTDTARHPLTWLICLLGVLMSYGAAYLKPEIFSYVLMACAVLTWWRLRTGGRRTWWCCYLLPVIMVVWVNTHGGCIFGFAFLGLVAVGEYLNGLFSPDQALPRSVRQHLFVSLVLSALTLVVTPYGLAYPLQLLQNLAHADEKIPYYKTISAYASIFAPAKGRLHYVDYLMMGAGLFMGLFLLTRRRRHPDWSLLLPTVCFGFLYTRFLRTTFYWAPVLSMSCVMMLRERSALLWPERRCWRRLIAGLVVVLALAVSGRAVYESVASPISDRWSGFGISYFNPVAEAEFIRLQYPGCRLGNDYDTGGYLLWRLWPEIKVMIDPRQFPYRSWYHRYWAFVSGTEIKELVEQLDCDVWCIRLPYRKVTRWFLMSPDWKLAFYGPVAAVFVPQDAVLDADAPRHSQSIGEIRNLAQALLTLSFASSTSDWGGVDMILAGMRQRFVLPNQRDRVGSAADYVNGLRAYARREYAAAIVALAAARQARVLYNNELLVRCYQHRAAELWQKNLESEALTMILQAAEIDPEDSFSLYNRGALSWHLFGRDDRTPDTGTAGEALAARLRESWREDLQKFLDRAETNRALSRQAVMAAQSILDGRRQRRPPLLVPAAPPKAAAAESQ